MRCNSEGRAVATEQVGCVVGDEDEDGKRPDVEEDESGLEEDKKEQGQSWGQNGLGCWLDFGRNGDRC